MSDELEQERPDGGGEPQTTHEDAFDDAADLLSAVETDAHGKKVVGLDKLIEQRKATKAQKDEIAQLKQKLAEYQGLDERVNRVMPIAEAVERDPTLAAEVRAALNGTRQSRPSTEQPADDAEALEYAQIHNLVTKDKSGSDVWDVARAARALEIEAVRAEKRVRPHIDSATEAAYGMRGEQNLSALRRMETRTGEILASEESINQALQESAMPAKYLADPRVARLVGLVAAGLDKENGRTPKAIEPLSFERAGGRRSTEPVFTDDDKRMARRAGLSDEELNAAGKRTANRRGEIDLEG